MYIKKLESWKNLDWRMFFLQFSFSEDQEIEIKQILTSETKKGIIIYFFRLKEFQIINGIGPGFFSNIFRYIITLFFNGVRYEFHDIMYYIGGNWKDKIKADYGLLKYSIKSIRRNFTIIKDFKLALLLEIFMYISLCLMSLFQFIIILFCFIMVLLFGWTSFRFISIKKI